MRIDLGPANRHAAICLSKVHFLSSDMKELLRKEGIWEDLVQELYTSGWEAYNEGMDFKDTFRYAQRRAYAFFKAYGFRIRCRRYVRIDLPFSKVFDFDINNRGLAPRDLPPLYFNRNGDNHLNEKMLALLRKHPEGLSRSKIAMRFQIPVWLVDRHLTPLIREGTIVEIKQDNARGRPLSPLLVAPSPDSPLPAPDNSARERDERIRKAYFVEGRSIKQIKKEYHHSKETIRRALGITERKGDVKEGES